MTDPDVPPAGRDAAIVWLRARHPEPWRITVDGNGLLRAECGAYTVSAETPERLDRAMTDYEEGRTRW